MTAGTQVLQGWTVVTGVVGDDVHVMGIRLVEHALESAGANVVSLGVMTPVQDFVEAAVETAADAVMISSSNGHAGISCDGIRGAFAEAGLGDMLLYIGGNLRVGSRSGAQGEVEQEFRALGFDRVFEPSVDLSEVMRTLADDLDMRGRRDDG